LAEETVPRDIDWYANAIDRPATAESVYSMAHAIRNEVGVQLFGDLPADAALRSLPRAPKGLDAEVFSSP
jgi:hypothetical protein